MVKVAMGLQKLERRLEQIFLWPQKKSTSPTTGPWTCNLENYEKVNSVVKPSQSFVLGFGSLGKGPHTDNGSPWPGGSSYQQQHLV